MRRRLAISYLALAVVTLVTLEIPLGVGFARNERRAIIAGVKTDALVLATLVEDDLESGGRIGSSAPERYAAETGARVVVTTADGTSVADSGGGIGRSFASRPEFASALSGRIASGIRRSSTLGYDIVFVAVPVASGGVVHGAVRVTYPAPAVSARIRRNWIALGAVAGVVLAVATIAALLLARSIVRPLAGLEDAAREIAIGNLTVRAPMPDGPSEIRDVTATFNDMASRLEELIGAQRSFVADASHQLRTPLTALRLRLENLEAGATGDGREDVEGALRETVRLAQIVDGLLLLARSEGSRPPRERIDVGAVAGERLAALAPMARDRDISFRVEIPAGVSVLAPRGHLDQILDNLLSNALAVAPPESVITITTRAAGDTVEIHVIDRGPGMTRADRARAFERFWRGEADSAGTGLGLAIVRRLTRISGGDVELRDAEGGGLDAVVRLSDVGQDSAGTATNQHAS